MTPRASFYSSRNKVRSVVHANRHTPRDCAWCARISVLVSDQRSHECVFSRVIYLQVSMNEGISYITSSVHITTTECVSTY